MSISSLIGQSRRESILKPDFLSMMNYTPTFQARVEHRIAAKSSVQFTPGICYGVLYRIFDADTYEEYTLRNLIGFNTRLEYRYYPSDSSACSLKGLYVAPELLYRSVWYQEGKYFLVHGPNFTYQRLLEYTVNRRVYAYHVKIGYQERLSPGMYIDFFAGLGRRIISIKNNRKVPDGATHISDAGGIDLEFYQWDDYGTKTRVSFTASVILGFLF
ncbi:MAG: hypothetical protein NZ455_06490 [Bacteroidia bacterium]|nr:hypothetical protein [Bacteroidia bacterium]MDW8347171.1 hypothetical protein [Bacteroidia bacterium]